MFIACVVKPPRESTVMLAAASLADVPVYDVEETVSMKKEPP